MMLSQKIEHCSLQQTHRFQINVILFGLIGRPRLRKDGLAAVVLSQIGHVQQDGREAIPPFFSRFVVVFELVVAIDPVQVRNVRGREVVAQNLQSIGVTLNVLVEAENVKAPSATRGKSKACKLSGWDK